MNDLIERLLSKIKVSFKITLPTFSRPVLHEKRKVCIRGKVKSEEQGKFEGLERRKKRKEEL